MTRFASACVVALLLGACVPPLPGTLDEPAPDAPAAGGSAPQTCSPSCAKWPGCSAPPVTSGLLAGFESGCAVVENIEGRDGSWSLYDGVSGAVAPTPIPISCQVSSGCYSACMRGTLVAPNPGTPSAVLAATLRANGAPYDASRYRGISFDALGVLGSARLLFRVVFERGDPFVVEVPGFSPMTNHRLGYERIEIDFSTHTRMTSLQWELVATDGARLDDESTICLDTIQLLAR